MSFKSSFFHGLLMCTIRSVHRSFVVVSELDFVGNFEYNLKLIRRLLHEFVTEAYSNEVDLS